MLLGRRRGSLSLGAGVALAAAVTLAATAARAEGPTKDECVDAHGRGQDAREAGQLSLARKLFLTCAQPSCPALLQGDCARFSDELDKTQPTVTFAARDSAQADLPDTAVYLDGVLMATRLDDGKIHDVDPGHHEIRFVNGHHEVTQALVVNEGERGRLIIAMFPAPRVVGQPIGVVPVEPPATTGRRPVFPLVLAGTGLALVGAGVTLGVLGLHNVPSSCGVADHACAVPPGDPALTTAKNAMTMTNVGFAVGGTGLAAMVVGLVWHFVAPTSKETVTGLVPWTAPHAAGLAFGAAL